MAIFRGNGGAGDSTQDASLTIVTAKALEATNSATAAAASAAAAAESEVAAAASETAAEAAVVAASSASRLTVGTVTTGDAGTSASATITGDVGSQVLSFAIPRGSQGIQGETGPQGEQGIQGEAGPQGIQGLTGDDGNGIVSVIRTSGNGAAGTTDTYTITYTDTTTSTFDVYNGSNGTGAGDMVKADNLAGLADYSVARSNLGLGSAATTDSTDYATAAQGALADSALQSADIGVTVQGYDATILNDADIGVTVQGYDATLLNDADIGVTVQAYDATLLNDADIGVNVQAYDANNTTASNTQTLTNKTIDYNSNTILNLPSAAAGGLSYVAKTTNYTTQNLEGVLANTSGGAFTVTLPASPSTGDQVVVADPTGDWATNNLTIGRNGETISNSAQDLVCDIGGASVQLVYDGSDWNVYAQVGGNGGTVVTVDGTQTLTNKTLKDYAIEGVAIGNTGATRTIDIESGNFFSATLDQACTFTFSNPVASGDFCGFVLELTNGGAFSITWPVSVDWTGGTAPSLTTAGVDQLVFTTRDGGTTYFGFVAGLDIK